MRSGSSRVLAIVCMVSGVNSAIGYRFGRVGRKGWVLAMVWLAGLDRQGSYR